MSNKVLITNSQNTVKNPSGRQKRGSAPMTNKE